MKLSQQRAHHVGIDERRRAYLYRCCARYQVFDDVFNRRNTATADNGDIDGFGTLIGHPQRYGLQRRARKPAHEITQFGFAGVNINGHG